MLSKMLYLAPVVFTTAGVTALVSFKIDDPKTKRILRIIAAVLALGSIVSFLHQASELVEALARTEKMVIEQRRLVEEEKAKAAEVVQRATEAKLKAEAEQQRLKVLVEEEARAARMRREQSEQAHRDALSNAAQEASAREADAERTRREAAAAQVARAANERRLRAVQHQNYCDQCCKQRAPSYYNGRMPADAIAICLGMCQTGRPELPGDAVICRLQ